MAQSSSGKERKEKEEYLYRCLSSVSVHQMAPPLTQVEDIQLQHTNHIVPEGMKG